MCLCSIGANAQAMNVNVMQTVTPVAATPYKQNGSGVQKKTTADTLSASDTSYLYFYTASTPSWSFDYKVTKVSGYVRPNAKLQATTDTAGDGAGTSTWYTFRGDRTYCFGCSDSTYTSTNASGRTVFQNQQSPLRFYRVRVINDTSAAGTSTPTGTMYWKK